MSHLKLWPVSSETRREELQKPLHRRGPGIDDQLRQLELGPLRARRAQGDRRLD